MTQNNRSRDAIVPGRKVDETFDTWMHRYITQQASVLGHMLNLMDGSTYMRLSKKEQAALFTVLCWVFAPGSIDYWGDEYAALQKVCRQLGVEL